MPDNLERIADLTEQLSASESDLSSFFELASDLFIIYDLEDESVRINGAWMEILGWTMEELLSFKEGEITHPDDRKKGDEAFENMKKTGASYDDFQVRYKHKDGHWVLISWRTRLNGETLYAVGRAPHDQERYLRRYERIILHRHALTSIIQELDRMLDVTGDTLDSLSLNRDRLNQIYMEMKAEE